MVPNQHQKKLSIIIITLTSDNIIFINSKCNTSILHVMYSLQAEASSLYQTLSFSS